MGVGSSHPVPSFPLRRKILAQGGSLLVSVCLVLLVWATCFGGGGVRGPTKSHVTDSHALFTIPNCPMVRPYSTAPKRRCVPWWLGNPKQTDF